MRHQASLLFTVFFLFSTLTAFADILYLRDGRKTEGTFLGGDSRTVRLILQDGQLGSFAITDAESTIFGTQAGSTASSAPAPTPCHLKVEL
jgi:hypothetical protein